MKKYMKYSKAAEVLNNAISENTHKCCGDGAVTFEVKVVNDNECEQGMLALFLADQKPFSGTIDGVPSVVLSLYKVSINRKGQAKIKDVIEMANDMLNWLTAFYEGKLDGCELYDDDNQVVRNELESALMVAANAAGELLDYIDSVEKSA